LKEVLIKSKTLLVLLVSSIIILVACESNILSGKVDSIEYDTKQIENPPPAKKSGYGQYNSWEEAFADGWENINVFGQTEVGRYSTEIKLTGFVIVKLADGKKIRCKNPFPDVSPNQEVKIKETASGDWVIAQ
jgi:hypothetical protein